jgi:proline iminopeptidase
MIFNEKNRIKSSYNVILFNSFTRISEGNDQMARKCIALLVMAIFLLSCERPVELERSDGYWEINGTKLHYVIIGHGDPIVVLHGGPGGNLNSMLSLVLFAPDYRWVFYDQRGSGESERFPVNLESLDEAEAFFSVERHIEDIEGIRKRLGVEKITVLGHSWGGALAVFYTAAHPNRVNKLIVYNGGPMWPELRAAKKTALEERSGPEINSRAAELVARISENIEIWDQKNIDAEFMKMIYLLLPAYDCHSTTPPTPEEVGRGGFWANQLTNRYIDVFDRDSFARKLAEIKAPTLITYGRCEPNPPERQTYLRDAIPNSAMVVFDESGHNAHREQPELFGRVLRAFLSDKSLPMEHYDEKAGALGWSAKRIR